MPYFFSFSSRQPNNFFFTLISYRKKFLTDLANIPVGAEEARDDEEGEPEEPEADLAVDGGSTSNDTKQKPEAIYRRKYTLHFFSFSSFIGLGF